MAPVSVKHASNPSWNDSELADAMGLNHEDDAASE